MEEEPKRISLPIYFFPKCLFMLIVLAAIIFISSCQPQADFDIRGSWEYTMTDKVGNIYDMGIIHFDGNPTKGTFLQTNIYDIEYDGEYRVKGNNIKLNGDENWDGIFANENNFSGTWQYDAQANGIFISTRKQ